MGQHALVEATLSIIFFGYGIACCFMYYVTEILAKITHSSALITYLYDCAYVVICFMPFYYFYVNFLDGVLHFYQVIFFIAGLVFYNKVLHNISKKFVGFYQKHRPNILGRLTQKIKHFLYK